MNDDWGDTKWLNSGDKNKSGLRKKDTAIADYVRDGWGIENWQNMTCWNILEMVNIVE